METGSPFPSTHMLWRGEEEGRAREVCRLESMRENYTTPQEVPQPILYSNIEEIVPVTVLAK